MLPSVSYSENWFTQESCTQFLPSGGNDYFSENYKNGGTPFFTDQAKRNHVNAQLQLFNDSFNTNLRVYCGRYFLSYDARWNWDTSLYSMFSPALRAAYSNYTNQYGSQSTSKSVIEIFYPTYKQYIETSGSNLLVVYLECHFYLNQDTTTEVGTMEVLGLLSRGISGDDILRISYLKSDRVTQAINSLESPQDKISTYVDNIVNEFFTPVQILNPHCPECPLHPNAGDSYWDEAGRLWTWMEGADHNLKWMDLSYEFPEEGQGYDLSWKTQIPNAVQEYHRALYLDKINFLRNDPLQRSLGGVPPALETEIWRATQFAAVTAMKERYVNQNIAIWENFIPVWGNARHAYYAFNVANGDLTYQVSGTVGIIMTAMDIILCDGFIHEGLMGALRSPMNFVTKGFSFINNLGSRIIVYGRQSVVKISLILALRNAPEATVTFFRNRSFQRAIEIFDQNAQRYIKHNPDDGKTIVAKYTEQLDGTSSLTYERELNINPSNSTNEQSIVDNVIIKVAEDAAGLSFKIGDQIAGKSIQNIRYGTNGKIAVIGRKMSDHVETVGSSLSSTGRDVELFNSQYQSTKTFTIKGQNYTWAEIENDFLNLNNQYEVEPSGWIKSTELPKTLMYQANEIWANKLISEGYTVIDIGFPPGVTTPSSFYSMEISTIFGP